MGQVQIKESTEVRRRLVGDFGTYEEYMEGWHPEIAFRPFGGWNYSYANRRQRDWALAYWAFVTLTTLGVDWREGAVVLGGAVLAQETVSKWGYKLFEEKEEPFNHGVGASWVFNVQAGYLAYHVLFKRNKLRLVWLASGAAVVSNLYVWLNDAELKDELIYINHYAHLEGFVVGLAAAYLLDFVFKKRKAVL